MSAFKAELLVDSLNSKTARVRLRVSSSMFDEREPMNASDVALMISELQHQLATMRSLEAALAFEAKQ